MRRTALVVVAALAVTACQDVATSPQAADINTAQARFSNPPPPPIEGSATLSIGTASQTFAAAQFEVTPALSEACEAALPVFVSIPVKYFLNRKQNSGWIKFDSDDDVEASANGMVKEHNGRESGHGTVTINDGGCEIAVNLASVDSVILGDCSGPPIIIDGEAAPAAAPEDNPEQACFYAEFDDVTADGEPVPGGATLFGDLGNNEEEVPSVD